LSFRNLSRSFPDWLVEIRDRATKHCPGGPKRLGPALDNFLGIVKSHFRDASTEKQAASEAWEAFSAPFSLLLPFFIVRLEESRKEIVLFTRRKIKGRILSRGPSPRTGDERETRRRVYVIREIHEYAYVWCKLYTLPLKLRTSYRDHRVVSLCRRMNVSYPG